jgi:hypothetical protein
MAISERENFRLNTTITVNGRTVEKVICAVYLPVEFTDPIRLLFYPTDVQARILRRNWKFSIRGEIKNYAGEVSTEIYADSVYASSLKTREWGSELRENILTAEPTDLKITDFRSSGRSSNRVSRVDGNFWLTPSTLLRPAKSFIHSVKGDVEVNTVREFTFTLPTGVKLSFDQHYHQRKNDYKEEVVFSELVANFEFEGKLRDDPKLNILLKNLEDLLLLASFAARHRCVCLGWEAFDASSHIKYYRRGITIPAEEEHSAFESEIIGLAEFPKFMKKAYAKLTKMESDESLRRAISFTIPKKGTILEHEYVALYSALEMLVLYFRRLQDLEFIITPNKLRGKVRKKLKEVIENEPLLAEQSSQKRGWMCDKLNELNRIPFVTAFEKFCVFYAIDLHDLWPVVGNERGPSLSTIRNKLVHGEVFDDRHSLALIAAKFHMQWSVERMILAVLGWPIVKSRVSPSYLSGGHAVYKGWEAHRTVLSS